MKYTVTPDEKSTVKIAITFTPEEWAAANDKAYQENRKKFAVNGFRKGKVPKHVLELYYGKGLFYEDALNDLFVEHYPAILEKEKDAFTPVGDPALAVEEISEEKVVLTAKTPVKPDVAIGKYTGIKIARYEYTVTDADVEKDIKGTRERLAESRDVTDRPAQEKDTVNIDFVGRCEGELFEGGSAKGFDLTLGSGQFIPGFEDQVIGMNVGESKDVNVTFPEDYQAETLKGKPAVFTVTVHKITEKVLPALDEEFAKKMGSDSVEAYRAKLRERQEKSAAYPLNRRHRRHHNLIESRRRHTPAGKSYRHKISGHQKPQESKNLFQYLRGDGQTGEKTGRQTGKQQQIGHKKTGFRHLSASEDGGEIGKYRSGDSD